MSAQSYTTTFVVPQGPDAVYAAVRDPRAWWNDEIRGDANQIGDEFVHEVPGLHAARLRVVEAMPNRRMVWRVLESVMTFLADDKGEWVGTHLIFDVHAGSDGTTVRFTHAGLTPAQSCYEICVSAWFGYLGRLRRLITAGAGRPYPERVTGRRADT